MKELLIENNKLLKENNEMLKHIIAYINKVDKNRGIEDIKDLVTNLVANMFINNRLNNY